MQKNIHELKYIVQKYGYHHWLRSFNDETVFEIRPLGYLESKPDFVVCEDITGNIVLVADTNIYRVDEKVANHHWASLCP